MAAERPRAARLDRAYASPCRVADRDLGNKPTPHLSVAFHSGIPEHFFCTKSSQWEGPSMLQHEQGAGLVSGD